MTLKALEGHRFVRKTQLAPGEYRKNFHQIDRDILAAVTSKEADAVTPLMSKIYLRLVNAPGRFWEREGVLRIEAELREEKPVKAWAVLCDLVGVSSATASKALRWMHEQGIIGYFSGRNGVGLRIFLNRAVASIGLRGRREGEKILALLPASSGEASVSANEPAFNDPFGDLESSDTDYKSRAPKNGAGEQRGVPLRPNQLTRPVLASVPAASTSAQAPPDHGRSSLEAVVSRLRAELEPRLREAAREAAAREHERTREWLESRGLPKAARVAHHETYNILRKYGVIEGPTRSTRSRPEVGRSAYAQPDPHPISDAEVTDLAQACLAIFETQGRPVAVTLSEMSLGAGGFLLPEDAERVRERTNSLLTAGTGRVE